jgi:sulfide:quinone oxidoreductase
MTQIIRLDEKTFVAGQIYPPDIPDIAESGVVCIVNNRPDGEDVSGQPSAQEIEIVTIRNGLTFAYLPFTAPSLTPELVSQFVELLNVTSEPLLAYCRTGNRSTMLWAAARIAQGASLDQVLERALAAKYDIRPAAQFIYALGKAAEIK